MVVAPEVTVAGALAVAADVMPLIPGSLCVDADAHAVGQIELSSRRK